MAVYKQYLLRNSEQFGKSTFAIFLPSLFVFFVGIYFYSSRITPVSNYPFFTPLNQQIIGGSMIALAVSLMMFLQGKILGISGILSGIFDPKSDDKFSRLSFFVGLLVAGEILFNVYPESIIQILYRPNWAFIVGGFLVGFGTGVSCFFFFFTFLVMQY